MKAGDFNQPRPECTRALAKWKPTVLDGQAMPFRARRRCGYRGNRAIGRDETAQTTSAMPEVRESLIEAFRSVLKQLTKYVGVLRIAVIFATKRQSGSGMSSSSWGRTLLWRTDV